MQRMFAILANLPEVIINLRKTKTCLITKPVHARPFAASKLATSPAGLLSGPQWYTSLDFGAPGLANFLADLTVVCRFWFWFVWRVRPIECWRCLVMGQDRNRCGMASLHSRCTYMSFVRGVVLCRPQVQASLEVRRQMGSRLVPILQAGHPKLGRNEMDRPDIGAKPGIVEHSQTDVWEWARVLPSSLGPKIESQCTRKARQTAIASKRWHETTKVQNKIKIAKAFVTLGCLSFDLQCDWNTNMFRKRESKMGETEVAEKCRKWLEP